MIENLRLVTAIYKIFMKDIVLYSIANRFEERCIYTIHNMRNIYHFST